MLTISVLRCTRLSLLMRMPYANSDALHERAGDRATTQAKAKYGLPVVHRTAWSIERYALSSLHNEVGLDTDCYTLSYRSGKMPSLLVVVLLWRYHLGMNAMTKWRFAMKTFSCADRRRPQPPLAGCRLNNADGAALLGQINEG